MSGVQKLHEEFARLRKQVIRPAAGLIKHDYLVPGGYYTQMWDWDGFFIGVHLISRNKENGKYLKWWAESFIESADESGYVPGCITVDGPHLGMGHFPMKPFLAQGCFLASEALDDFEWLKPHYETIKRIVRNRENTNFDPNYGLFFWDNAMQSGADNNPALPQDVDKANWGTVLACDVNTFQLREYLALREIASRLGNSEDEARFGRKCEELAQAIEKHLWFEQEESYFNVVRATGEPVKRVTYSNFVPLVQKLAPPENGQQMIGRYLWNEDHMRSKFGLRSLSKQDEAYNNDLMIAPYSNWQGPIWPLANYLYFRGLMNYGFASEAAELAETMMDLCLTDIEKWGSMHENYNAESGEPLAPSPEHFSTGVFEGFVGWNLLVENMQEEVPI